MLELREFKEDERQQIEELLSYENIEDLSLDRNVTVLVEDGLVLGVCKVNRVKEKVYLQYLIIKEASRGDKLGDGLLRTVLNKLDLQGLEKIYYDFPDSYLVKKGFKENGQGLLELDISKFFNVGCTCSGKTNEL